MYTITLNLNVYVWYIMYVCMCVCMYVCMQLTIFELPAAVVEAANFKVDIPVRVSTPTYVSILVVCMYVCVYVCKVNDPCMYVCVQENRETGFAEMREELQRLEMFSPPAFRIVGYDPRSKKKVSYSIYV